MHVSTQQLIAQILNRLAHPMLLSFIQWLFSYSLFLKTFSSVFRESLLKRGRLQKFHSPYEIISFKLTHSCVLYTVTECYVTSKSSAIERVNGMPVGGAALPRAFHGLFVIRNNHL